MENQVQVHCPECRCSFKVPAGEVGYASRLHCPECGQEFALEEQTVQALLKGLKDEILGPGTN